MKSFYKYHVFIFSFIFISIILYNINYQLQMLIKPKIVEPFFKKAFKKVSSGLSGAAKTVAGTATSVAGTISNTAQSAAAEAQRAAEAAAAEAKKIAEEAAMALQIDGLVKDFNNGVDKVSNAFDSVGSGISEIKGLGSSLSNDMKSISTSLDKLSK
jgi:phage-related protein